ncbi:MAG: sulfite exporter TauE/SafE family protein, partial [Candidatus Gracilibacteria bacterium]
VIDAGYSITSAGGDSEAKSNNKNKLEDYFQIFAIGVGVLVLVSIFNQLGVAQLFPNFTGKEANIFVALAVGIVASVSTCLALIGGIVLSFGSMYKGEGTENVPLGVRARPHIYFHIGRIGSFVLLGGLLGVLGSKISYSATFTGYFTLFIALVMFYIGLHILGFVPNITKLGFHLPKFLSSKIHSLQDSNHKAAPLIIGALTFFLPCGLTQSMQLAAVGSQSFLSGALIMGAFALGTLPVLLSLGIGSTYAQKNKFGFVQRVVGVIIIFFAFYSMNSGLVLTGSKFSFNLSGGQSTVVEVPTENGVQTVKMDIDYSFSPSRFNIKKGVPVRWEINGINLGCADEIVVPSLGIRQRINLGANVIEFTPTKSGSLPFSCGMGMITGKFIVT